MKTTITFELETPFALSSQELIKIQGDIEDALLDGLRQRDWRVIDIMVLEVTAED